MIDKLKTWLVAVSGGRDSVCLLDWAVKNGLEKLVVVHVNHQLRGEMSDGDAEFVKQLAQQYGLPIYTESVDVSAVASEQKKGLELAAREVRHAVFARALQKHDASGVLLGHHAEDQAETVLYHLLRGSNGLRGMRSESEVVVNKHVVKLLRPLLKMRRSEIDSYIAKYHLRYREDVTNAEGFTARNRIRNEVMPLLKEIMQRDIVPTVNVAAEASMEVAAFVESEAVIEDYLDPQGRLYLPSFIALHRVLQLSVLFQFFKLHKVPEINRNLLTRCLTILGGDAPAKINLPGGRWLRRKEQRLFIQV